MKQSLGFLVVRDYEARARHRVRARKTGDGTVAVFRDLYGNLWDLLGPPAAPSP